MFRPQKKNRNKAFIYCQKLCYNAHLIQGIQMISISTNKDSFLGLSTQDDSRNEETIYRVGSHDYMPIALFLLLASGIKQPYARYCYAMNHYDVRAKEWAEKLDNQTNTALVETLKDQFESKDKVLGHIGDSILKERGLSLDERNKLMQSAIHNQPRDIVLPLHLYAKQFAQHYAQRTAGFEAISSGIVMTCPPSYIGYWNRPEFAEPYKAIDKALDMIMEDVIRIFKLNEVAVMEYNNTVYAPGFTPVEFRHYYGW